MSALRPPGLGPIIGHTTHNSCRLWIRAKDPEDEGAKLSADRRTIGVIGLLSADPEDDPNAVVERAYYFRLQREFDRTGTFVLGEDVALGQHKKDFEPDSRGRTRQGAPEQPTPLEPDKKYFVRMATLSTDDPLPDAENLDDRELADLLPRIENIGLQLLQLPADRCQATFTTFPAPDKRQEELAFLLGSCRYPGFLWKIKEADSIFEPMREHLRGRRKGYESPPRFTLMMGDQIYADLLNKALPVLRADTYEEFQDRYHEAFSGPNMRKLMRTAPVYMALDDHEIEDNWTQDQLLKDQGKHHLFNIAISAYMSYQWSHGPRTFGRLLYYHFECGGYPFFVLDTRTQRFKDDKKGLTDNHLLGRPTIDPDPENLSQLDELLKWLSGQQKNNKDAPKFIVSSSVFAPNDIKERIELEPDAPNPGEEVKLFHLNDRRRDGSDSWPAYPRTKQAILNHIVKEKIQNVVFLTGDIHCSNIARMRFTISGQDVGIVAYDITSSAFYWPFPFADGDPNNYVHDSAAKGQGDPFPIRDKDGKEGDMHYRAWAFTQEDNFCRIDIDKSKKCLNVTYFDRSGKPLELMQETGKAKSKTNVLPLASWT